MTRCGACGMESITDNGGLCPHHVSARDSAWCVANRIMNDLLMRGIEPVRLPLEQRAESWETASTEAWAG